MSRRAFSVATFVLNGGDVLLIEHKRLRLWLPVGGEIEPGESPLEAARREVKEETGLDVEYPVLDRRLDGCPPGFIGYEEHDAGSKGTHLNFNFVAFSPSRTIVGDGSFGQHAWLDIETLVDRGPKVEHSPVSVWQCICRIRAARWERRLP